MSHCFLTVLVTVSPALLCCTSAHNFFCNTPVPVSPCITSTVLWQLQCTQFLPVWNLTGVSAVLCNLQNAQCLQIVDLDKNVDKFGRKKIGLVWRLLCPQRLKLEVIGGECCFELKLARQNSWNLLKRLKLKSYTWTCVAQVFYGLKVQIKLSCLSTINWNIEYI